MATNALADCWRNLLRSAHCKKAFHSLSQQSTLCNEFTSAAAATEGCCQLNVVQASKTTLNSQQTAGALTVAFCQSVRSISTRRSTVQFSIQPAASQVSRRGLSSDAAAGQRTLPASEADKQTGRKGWVLIAPALFAGFLGCWQVNRYQWKVKLVAEREQALKAEPLNLRDLPDAPTEFAKVAAEGTYAHDRCVYIGPRPRSSMGTATPGYTLVTPLLADEWGKGALVMRGWVPATWRSQPDLRKAHEPPDKVHVEGIVRTNDKPSMFVPANSPDRREFFWVDVPALVKACEMPEGTPLIEAMEKGEKPMVGRGNIPTQMDVLAMRTQSRNAASTSLQADATQAPAEPLPIPRNEGDLLKHSVTPTDHRNYALTWFTLSGATSFMALRILRPK